MPKYTYDHIHLRTKNPEEMAAYFERIFDARVIHSVQSDGFVRTDLDIDGLMVFIAPVPAEEDMESSPRDPHLGLDHFGFRVENLEETVAELKQRGSGNGQGAAHHPARGACGLCQGAGRRAD